MKDNDFENEIFEDFDNSSASKSGNRLILVTTIVLGVLLVGMIIFSIGYFYVNMKNTKNMLGTSENKTYDRYYVLITSSRETDFWKNVYEGALSEALKSNAYIELMGDGLEDNLTKRDLIKIATSSKVDGIIVEGDDDNKTLSVLRDAMSEGIPVVTVASDVPEGERISYIGISGYNLGKEYGEQLVSLVQSKEMDKCNILVLMDDSITGSSQSVILTAIKETLDSSDLNTKIGIDSKVVSTGKGYAAEEEIRDIFVSENETPDIIVCLSEKNTICVYQTVVDYNKVGEVEILGFYMSPTIKSAIQKNIIKSSMVVDSEQMGQKSVEALNEYLESGYVSEFYMIDSKQADAENLDSFETEGGEE